jgi:hypothetical protein
LVLDFDPGSYVLFGPSAVVARYLRHHPHILAISLHKGVGALIFTSVSPRRSP